MRRSGGSGPAGAPGHRALLTTALIGVLVALPMGPAGLSAQSASADDPTIRDDLALVGDRIGYGLTAPLRWSTREWLAIPAGAIVLAAISPMDDGIQRLVPRNRSDLGDAYFGAVEPFGQGSSWVVIGGLYAGGWVTGRVELRNTAMKALGASVVAAGIVTPVLKELVGRVRPRYTDDPYQFWPLSGHHAWPSGHTTQAFALASVIAAESPHRAVDALAWTLAASVGAARIYHDAHWLTDVLAGAAIGTVTGRAMAGGGDRADTAAGSGAAEDRPTLRFLAGPSNDGGVTAGLLLRF